MSPTLVRADTPHLWSAAAALVRQYADALSVSLDFQDFQHELRHLSTEYGPPDGVFLLAEFESHYVGCGAIRRFSASDCEMKRLFVVPDGQHRGIGRLIATALIEQARELGYTRMLLDTLPEMQRAHTLYASLGFRPIAAYRFNPIPGTTFMQLDL
jgi:GNAT superfamily N-acetyltransferase